MEDRIREILNRCGRLSCPASEVGLDDDLYDAGLSSLATVNVMLAIEDSFSLEIPDHFLTRKSFQTISSLIELVVRLESVAVAS